VDIEQSSFCQHYTMVWLCVYHRHP